MCQFHRFNYTKCTDAPREPHAFHVLESCPPRKAEKAGSFCPSPTTATGLSSGLELPCPLCNHIYYDLPFNVKTTPSTSENKFAAIQHSLRHLDIPASQQPFSAGRSSPNRPSPRPSVPGSRSGSSTERDAPGAMVSRASPVRQPQSSSKPVKQGQRTGGSPRGQSGASPMKTD